MIDLFTVILWALGIALVLVVLRILWQWLSLAVMFAVFIGTIVLILDKLAGGTALEQIANKITNWLKTQFNL